MINIIKDKFKSSAKKALRLRNPKNYYTPDIFAFAGLSIMPAWMIGYISYFLGVSPITAMTYPVFIFFVIFWALIVLNNKIYFREKAKLEHLIAVNKIDTIDILNQFVASLPDVRKKESKELVDYMTSVFGKEQGKDLAASFVQHEANVLPWLLQLDILQREKLYRYFLPE